jgi:hypothetical protein
VKSEVGEEEEREQIEEVEEEEEEEQRISCGKRAERFSKRRGGAGRL